MIKHIFFHPQQYPAILGYLWLYEAILAISCFLLWGGEGNFLANTFFCAQSLIKNKHMGFANFLTKNMCPELVLPWLTRQEDQDW